MERVVDYLKNSIKNQKKIGLELEHFIVDDESRPISYAEMIDVFDRACSSIGVVKHSDGVESFIARDYTITLEPGCQMEISIAPENSLDCVNEIYQKALEDWEPLFRDKGYHFEIKGILPAILDGQMEVDDIELIPKNRYANMNEYFTDTGKYGKYMMRASAAAQVSVDYESEEDAMRKLRIFQILVPIISLLTDNSFTENTTYPFGKHLSRVTIWESVDDDRCGFIPDSLESYSFEKYAKYVNSVPHIVDIPEESVEQKISFLFNYVRLKNVIEYRMADSVSIEKCLGLCALIKGLVYSDASMKKLDEYFKDIRKISQLNEAMEEIKKNGYDAKIFGKDLKEIIAFLFGIAKEGLKTLDSEKDIKQLNKLKPSKIYLYEYTKDIDENLDEHEQSAKKEKADIEKSTAFIHDHFIKTCYVPKLFTEDQIQQFENIVEQMCDLEEKVIALYFEDKKIRKIFGFDKILEKLILRCEPKSYGVSVPIQRIDIFYDEEQETYKLCEINTDGTSAMNEDREIAKAISDTLAFKQFSEKYKLEPFELFDSWIDVFLQNYKMTSADKPNVVIADFLDDTSMNEFEYFKERFEARGITTEIVDVREISYDGKVATTKSGMKIDAMYRRAVTSDTMKHYKEVRDFINAIKDDAFIMMGDFITQIPHSKMFVVALHDSYVQSKLSARDKEFIRKHIPETYLWNKKTKKMLSDQVNEKANWVLKPADSYASKGVYLGKETEEDVWTKALDETLNKGYVIQRFQKPYRLPNYDFVYSKEGSKVSTSNLTGLFTYNGKFKGVYSRISFDELISSQTNELTLPTFRIKD